MPREMREKPCDTLCQEVLRVQALSRLSIVLVAGWGSPAPVVNIPSAELPDAAPLACATRRLAFHPAGRYDARESDRAKADPADKKPYRSTIVFTPIDGGWKAIERGFE